MTSWFPFSVIAPWPLKYKYPISKSVLKNNNNTKKGKNKT
jgi:hypothetical protein